MTPEGKVTNQIRRYLQQLRTAGERVWWAKLHGGPMQKAGIPDMIVIFRGLTYWVEIKAPGKPCTPLQHHCHLQIAKAGGMVMIVKSLDAFQSLLGLSPLVSHQPANLEPSPN